MRRLEREASSRNDSAEEEGRGRELRRRRAVLVTLADTGLGSADRLEGGGRLRGGRGGGRRGRGGGDTRVGGGRAGATDFISSLMARPAHITYVDSADAEVEDAELADVEGRR